MAYEYPAHGQARAANELPKGGILVSSGGARSIWLRHNLETFKKRLNLFEEKGARLLRRNWRRERESHPDEIETEHPGYLISQDTFYVGYLKGVGRIYQQAVVDTYSSVTFAKVYTARIPFTAADILDDQIPPFFGGHDIPVLEVLTDRGTEFCGSPDNHP